MATTSLWSSLEEMSATTAIPPSGEKLAQAESVAAAASAPLARMARLKKPRDRVPVTAAGKGSRTVGAETKRCDVRSAARGNAIRSEITTVPIARI
jgi:hypothetical protein